MRAQRKRVKNRPLWPRQIKAIDGLAAGQTTDAVCTQLNVRPGTLRRWMENEVFRAAFERRIKTAEAYRTPLLAGRAAEAMAKLTVAGNGETARRACADFLKLHSRQSSAAEANPETGEEKPTATPEPLEPETAARLLKELADEADAERDRQFLRQRKTLRQQP